MLPDLKEHEPDTMEQSGQLSVCYVAFPRRKQTPTPRWYVYEAFHWVEGFVLSPGRHQQHTRDYGA